MSKQTNSLNRSVQYWRYRVRTSDLQSLSHQGLGYYKVGFENMGLLIKSLAGLADVRSAGGFK